MPFDQSSLDRFSGLSSFAPISLDIVRPSRSAESFFLSFLPSFRSSRERPEERFDRADPIDWRSRYARSRGFISRTRSIRSRKLITGFSSRRRRGRFSRARFGRTNLGSNRSPRLLVMIAKRNEKKKKKEKKGDNTRTGEPRKDLDSSPPRFSSRYRL